MSQCRFCKANLVTTFADLGMTPLANSYVSLDASNAVENFYPLHAYVCDECHLVQLDEFESAQGIFSDYAYFSSYSDSWLAHAEKYVNMVVERFDLKSDALAVEIASNDGYLLQYFADYSVPVLGIEPARNVAAVAIEKGIPTESFFFGEQTGKALQGRGITADLMIANNVLAHVPDLNDFVAGFKYVLKDNGVLTLEFPHLLTLIEGCLFDTIYHEHFSYFSLHTAIQVFKKHGLSIFDVEQVPTHGGSLRVFVCKSGMIYDSPSDRVANLLELEREAGLLSREVYLRFAQKVVDVKCDLLDFLISARRDRCSVVAYGAPAKGNTLLNYCGVGRELIEFTVDRNPVKQNTLLPGTRIPVLAVEAIKKRQPDYVLILPWNIKDEIMQQLSFISQWGGRFVVPLPNLSIV
jgi:SAM-dependent methyltransferase